MHGQCSLFAPPPEEIPPLPALTDREVWEMETRALGGLALRAHPLAWWRDEIARVRGRVDSVDLTRWGGRRVALVGWKVAHRRTRTCRGEQMLFLTLEDEAGLFEAILFPPAYRRFGHLAIGPGPFAVRGRVEVEDGYPTLNASDLQALNPTTQ